MGTGDGTEMPYLIDLWITENDNWSTTKERGRIQDIIISNVTVLAGKTLKSRIQGYDEIHKITDVTIENVIFPGNQVMTEDDLIEMRYAENIIVK